MTDSYMPTMIPVLAINNSPYYFLKPSMLRSIGLNIPQNRKIVSKLTSLMMGLSEQYNCNFLPGIQLGIESDTMLRSSRELKHLKKLRDETGIEFIVHIPDFVVPGKYKKDGVLDYFKLCVARWRTGFKDNFEDFLLERIEAAHQLESRFMVLHPPNGREESIEKTVGFFSRRLTGSLENHNITLCIENYNHMGAPFFSEVCNVENLLSKLDDNYAMCFDYGHYIVKRDVINKKELHKAIELSKVHHVHINDKISDKHLFLGERSEGISCNTLEEVEDIYINEVLKKIGLKANVFVFERNKAFSPEDIKRAVDIFVSTLSS
ncbi:MAG: sugar phosphate isomerase/epimerase family protein [Candidatus Methanofastidiosia archaeon]